jgi:hypothetical protein
MVMKLRISLALFLVTLSVSACGGAPVALSLISQVSENPVVGDLVISLAGDGGDPINLNLGDLTVKEYTTKLPNPSKDLTIAIVGANPAESVTMHAPNGDAPKATLTMTVTDDQINLTWGTAATAPTGTLPRANPVRAAREAVAALAKVTLAAVEPYVTNLAGALKGYDKDWIRIAGSANGDAPYEAAMNLWNKWAIKVRAYNIAFQKIDVTLARSNDEASIGLLIDDASNYGNMLYSCFHGASNPSQPSPATCFGAHADLKSRLDADLEQVRAKAQ